MAVRLLPAIWRLLPVVIGPFRRKHGRRARLGAPARPQDPAETLRAHEQAPAGREEANPRCFSTKEERGWNESNPIRPPESTDSIRCPRHGLGFTWGWKRRKPDGVGWKRVPRAPRLWGESGVGGRRRGRSGGRAARVGGGDEEGLGEGFGEREIGVCSLMGLYDEAPFYFARFFYKSHVVVTSIISSRWIGYTVDSPSTTATIHRWLGSLPFILRRGRQCGTLTACSAFRRAAGGGRGDCTSTAMRGGARTVGTQQWDLFVFVY